MTPDDLLRTTRSVRQRLDLRRPVEPEVLTECVELALQAPTGSNNQNWHFLFVTDARQRQALGDLYRRGFATYCEQAMQGKATPMRSTTPTDRASMRRLYTSSHYLLEHMHEVPVMLIPCIEDRVDGAIVVEQANAWGSILPATWSFMLAARARGLGTCWTTLHLYHEQEAATILGIPYETVMQVALIPVAYTLGTAFKAAPRHAPNTVMHWNRW